MTTMQEKPNVLTDASQADPKDSALRSDLAACYRLIAHFRMSDLTYTHISARCANPDHFLLNAFGLMFDEVNATNLVKVDADGRVIEDTTGLGVNPAGFVIHSALHAARPDVNCVLHTHTAAGMAVSTHPDGLLPITQHAMRFHRRIGRHAYEGIAIDIDERERLARDLGPHKALILQNHGLLTCGATVAEGFGLMYFLERACQAQVAALSGGYRPIAASPESIERTVSIYDEYGAVAGEQDWRALRRLLDRVYPSYKD